MNSMLSLVKQMHEQFGIDCKVLDEFTDTERTFRIVAMQEELDEYKDSTNRYDDLDALVDLVVFALGTAERQGMLSVFEEAFERVMHANMQKQLGANTKRGSFNIDLVKPDGWKAPDLEDLV